MPQIFKGSYRASSKKSRRKYAKAYLIKKCRCKKVFNTIKFIQALGASVLVTIVVSFIIGFIPIESYGLFLFIQTLITYGSMGFFAAKWNPKTPYTAAYLGALIISVCSLLLSHYVFNIFVFTNPDGVASSLSLAVVVSLFVAFLSTFIPSKREGALQ
jgi:hypothetical protein